MTVYETCTEKHKILKKKKRVFQYFIEVFEEWVKVSSLKYFKVKISCAVFCTHKRRIALWCTKAGFTHSLVGKNVAIPECQMLGNRVWNSENFSYFKLILRKYLNIIHFEVDVCKLIFAWKIRKSNLKKKKNFTPYTLKWIYLISLNGFQKPTHGKYTRIGVLLSWLWMLLCNLWR